MLQSVAGDVLLNMDLDFESLGTKRLIPLASMASLDSYINQQPVGRSSPSTLRRLGEGAMHPWLAHRSALVPVHAAKSMHTHVSCRR